jgi:UDP-N-acetylglucosamine diphosphorylase / glucose-1-phosphate thymidylyltransferase / UDP-N-acetylgalactosamine diphosphorylase / glucosamine-1-phosphate N-acetyltransferase / galactosamine-1-phosphate N-acetyltransferase
LKLVAFEDDATIGFGPLTMLRHVGQLNRGTKTLLEAVRASIADSTDLVLWGRDCLKDVCRESLESDYNERVDGPTTFVNARARPGKLLLEMTSRKTPFVAVAEGQIVAARVSKVSMVPGPIGKRDAVRIGKSVEKLEAPADSLFTGYWDLVQSNGLAIAEQARRFEDPLSLPSAVEVRGPRSNLRVNGRADVEMHVTFDTRLGPVVVEEGASVESFSRIMGPCYVGPRTKVYSAEIGGGTSVFDGCKVGGQLENSIIMSHSNKTHHGYVGDSYVGEWVNLGAGSTFSNLKNTYGNVRLNVGRRRIDSGMLKLGPAVGDMSKVSIGALVYSGRLLGTGCQVAGLADKNVPSFTYSDGSGRMVELLLESVLETQRRMMERRGKTLTRAGEALIRKAFRDTTEERRKAGVRKGYLS